MFTHVLARQGFREAYELTETAYFRPRVSSTFHGRDIFGPVAAHLASGVPANHFGPQVETLITFPVNPPHAVDQEAVGEIVHIDHFGNIVTNVTPDLLGGLQNGQKLSFTINERRWTVSFCPTYGMQPKGRLMALVSSNDTLEIALTQGSASAQVRAPVGARIAFERQL